MKKLVALLLLASCTDSTTVQFEAKPMVPDHGTEGDRFEVRFVQKIEDSLAYNNERGVYVIVDRQTGKEYVGVSGVGIAEAGQHQSGKHTVSDER